MSLPVEETRTGPPQWQDPRLSLPGTMRMLQTPGKHGRIHLSETWEYPTDSVHVHLVPARRMILFGIHDTTAAAQKFHVPTLQRLGLWTLASLDHIDSYRWMLSQRGWLVYEVTLRASDRKVEEHTPHCRDGIHVIVQGWNGPDVPVQPWIVGMLTPRCARCQNALPLQMVRTPMALDFMAWWHAYNAQRFVLRELQWAQIRAQAWFHKQWNIAQHIRYVQGAGVCGPCLQCQTPANPPIDWFYGQESEDSVSSTSEPDTDITRDSLRYSSFAVGSHPPSPSVCPARARRGATAAGAAGAAGGPSPGGTRTPLEGKKHQ